MRTVIYARYSSQLQNARSIEDQIAVCRERADREGWTVVDVFTDYAISGAAGMDEAQRPGLNAMLDRVERGGIDQLLADTTSRIARDQGDAYRIRKRLEFAGARIFTLADGEVDDIKGWVKGFLDSQQRKDLAHNIRRAQGGVVREGRSPAGIAYGYRRANKLDENGNLVRGLREIDPDQAAIVVRIFTETAAGHSPRSIAERLNADRIPGPRGDHWRAGTIRGQQKRGDGMLRNRLYVGELVHFRNTKVQNPTTRRTVIRTSDTATVEQQVPHLQIVDRALWNAAQAAIETVAGRPAQATRRPRHLLSGLGRCGVCGAGWIRISGDFWGCASKREGSGCANNRSIKTARYESEVLDMLRDRLLTPDLVSAYLREFHKEFARRAGETTRERATLQRQLEELRRKVDRLATAIADGGGEFAEFRDLLTRTRQERDTIERRIAEIDALPVLALHPGLADDYRRRVAALSEALAGNAAAHLEAIPKLRALIDHIVLTPKAVGRSVDIEVVGRLAELIKLAGVPAIAAPSSGEPSRIMRAS